MTQKHSSTETISSELSSPTEPTILDIIDEQFWNPYAELLKRIEEHEEHGLDTAKLQHQVAELTALYFSLGGQELTSAEENVTRIKPGPAYDKAVRKFELAQEKFYENLVKHENPTSESAEQEQPEPVVVEPIAPPPSSSPSPPPPPTETPRAPENEKSAEQSAEKPAVLGELEIAVGEKVWYADKPKDDSKPRQWSNEWEIIAILPPKDGKPELIRIKRGSEIRNPLRNTLTRLHNMHQSTEPTAASKESSSAAKQPKKASTEAVLVPTSPENEHVEAKNVFIETLKNKLAEMVVAGRISDDEAKAKLDRATSIDKGFSHNPRRDAFAFASTDLADEEKVVSTFTTRNEKNRRRSFNDDPLDEWFMKIMSDPNTTPAEKEANLRMGPNPDKPKGPVYSGPADAQQLEEYLALRDHSDILAQSQEEINEQYDEAPSSDEGSYSDEAWDKWYSDIVGSTLSREKKREALKKGYDWNVDGKSDIDKLRDVILGSDSEPKKRRYRKIGRQVLPANIRTQLKKAGGSLWEDVRNQAYDDTDWILKRARKYEHTKYGERAKKFGRYATKQAVRANKYRVNKSRARNIKKLRRMSNK